MARLFARQYHRCSWDPTELAGPLAGASLREWEVAVILCSQVREIEAALRDWLEGPTDHQRWPWPARLDSQRPRFLVGELAKPLDTLLDLFYEEIKAIRQTLDMPFAAFGGINRDVLLAMHGQRLRWLVRRLGVKHALGEIARFTQPINAAKTA